MSKAGFKERLKGGRPALGCLANMASPIAAEILAHAGYDGVMVDLEHGFGGIANAIHQMQAIEAAGAAPLMRVPDNDPVHLKRALDAGPHGVMVPMVSSADEARAAVAACRYPPEGVRGVGHPVARASGYGVHVEDYLGRFADDFLLICQIETLAGVENVDSIAAQDGVDMLFVGPLDLAASAGHFNDPDHRQVDALLMRVLAAAKDAGKLSGVLATAGRPAPSLFERGFDLVLDSVDIALLREAAQAKVEAVLPYTREKEK